MIKFFTCCVAFVAVWLNMAYSQSDYEAKVTASDGVALDDFGRSVSMSEDYAIVGASKEDSLKGAAYIFKRDGTSWIERIKLTADDGAAGDRFGWSVSISGNYAIIGAWLDDDKGEDSGSAYIFKRDDIDATKWTQEAKLIASDTDALDQFGFSVSIYGDYAIIGAAFSTHFWPLSGAAYIFKRDGSIWKEQKKLIPDDSFVADFFGISVSIFGSRAIVGAAGKDSGIGAAYIFARNGDIWGQEAKLAVPNGTKDDFLGWSVSMSNTYAIVGADLDDDNGEDSGSAHIFKRFATTWSHQAKLTASDGTALDDFGRSVSLSGDYAIVGAAGPFKNGAKGSAYLFKRNEETWIELTKITASDGAANDQFGFSASIAGDYAIIGANQDDDHGEDSGSAYIYNLARPFANDDRAITGVNTQIDIDILANDADSKGTLLPSTVVVVSDPADGAAHVNAVTGVVTYKPNPGFNGTDSFIYTVQNNLGVTSNRATVTIMVGTTIDHLTKTVNFRLFNNGVYGFDEFENTIGGFSFMGRPGRTLFSGGFVAGTGQSQLALNMPSFSSDQGAIIDFVTVSGFLQYPSNGNFDQIAECVYDEGGTNITNNPIGITVKQTSFSRNDDDFVILKLAISNPTTTTISNLYVGQFADWDVGNFSANRGAYDRSRDLLFQFEQDGANDPNLYGIAALSAASGARLHSGDFVLDSVFSYISNFNGPGPQPVVNNDDYRSFIGSGPYRLEPGDSVVIGFSWVAGVNLSDLQANADKAKQLWDTIKTGIDDQDISALSAKFVLAQNYPNPFNPSTTIQFNLPKASSVVLKVYDLLGQEIETLINEKRPAGKYQVRWTANDLPSGIYFYRLQAGEFVETKKLILQK